MRPRLLDLFCGAGGASMGYHRAGFDVVGVDLAPQPNYPFEFIQTDAVALLQNWQAWRPFVIGPSFAAIHASPPCQAYANVTAWRGKPAEHPDLLAQTRDLLTLTRLPWVIENAPEAPLHWDALCCGSHFGLRVKRHRAFEFSWARTLLPPDRCRHGSQTMPFMHKGEGAYRDAMDALDG